MRLARNDDNGMELHLIKVDHLAVKNVKKRLKKRGAISIDHYWHNLKQSNIFYTIQTERGTNQ